MYCSNCGKEINDAASFCPYCGQKSENMVQGAGGSTPKKPKKKHTALDVVCIVLGSIVLGCVILFAVFAFIGMLLSGGQASDSGSGKDTYFDAAIESVQGDWYLWADDDAYWHFSIAGTDYKLFIQNPKTLEITEVSGRIEPVERTYSVDKKSAYISGELKFIDSDAEKKIRYTYPNGVSGSTELEYWNSGLGDEKMKRYDYFGRIRELLQGQWTWTATGESGTEYYVTLKVEEDNNYSLLILTDTQNKVYAGKMSLYRHGGRIYLCDDEDIVLLELRFQYDEDTDSITLRDGESELEKVQ